MALREQVLINAIDRGLPPIPDDGLTEEMLLDLLKERVRETTNNLGHYIDQVYTRRTVCKFEEQALGREAP